MAAFERKPQRYAGNYAVYAIADRRLWQSGLRSVHGFVRLSASPTDRNIIDLYLDGGLSMTALLRGRPNDVFGIGFAYARISPRLRSRIHDRADLTGTLTHPPRFEGVIEASYQVKISDAVYVQPNLQLILHPAGALLGDPEMFEATPRNALVLGLRSSARF